MPFKSTLPVEASEIACPPEVLPEALAALSIPFDFSLSDALLLRDSLETRIATIRQMDREPTSFPSLNPQASRSRAPGMLEALERLHDELQVAVRVAKGEAL